MKKLSILAVCILLMLAVIPSAMAATCNHPSRQWVTELPAGCKTDGSKAYKCTKCGHVFARKSIPKIGGEHNYPTVKKASQACRDVKQCSKCPNKVYIVHHYYSGWRYNSKTKQDEKVCDCGENKFTQAHKHSYVVSTYGKTDLVLRLAHLGEAKDYFVWYVCEGWSERAGCGNKILVFYDQNPNVKKGDVKK